MKSNLNKKILTGVILWLTWMGLVAPSWANLSAVRIVEIKGDVKLKRSRWKKYRKARPGDVLSPSDQLQLSAGASAQVKCNNLKIWYVPTGKVSQVASGCPGAKKVASRANNRRSTTRAPSETIPYIISPRNTFLLTNRPLLRWNAVPGASRYRVELRGGGLDWQTETSSTQIKYPGNPPLEAGSRYLLSVTTDKRVSSEAEEGANLRFSRLDASQIDSVRAGVNQLQQEQLTKEAKGLALADLYQEYQLNAEAIELLENLVKEGTQTPVVYQLLGDIYSQVGLSLQARNHYSKALELARGERDLEGQAEATFGLATAEYALGKRSEAKEWLTQARANYQSLGDNLKIEEIEQWMKNY